MKIWFLLWLALAGSVAAQPTWQKEFAKMPLTERVTVLNRHNCVRVMLSSFKRNDAVQALIFMPGATDEFYFFRRARATLSNSAPTLLDAVIALTNQTYVRADYNPPFLLIHTGEDSLEPIIRIDDQKTADRVKKKHFESHGLYNDRDWDYMEPILKFDLATKMFPGLNSYHSRHFFRHSFAEYDLKGWDALRAVALAGKTCFSIEKNFVYFYGDERIKAPAVPPNPDFLYDKNND